jgi:AcrR family transcriptional regulator
LVINFILKQGFTKMKRGRPRKTDPDIALDTAMKVFWDNGYEGTSMNDLVVATGMAKPGLYAAFGDKEGIYTKALKHYFHQYATPLLDDILKSTDRLEIVIRRALQTIADSASDKTGPSGCFAVHSIIECASQPPALETLGRAFNEKRHKTFLKRFRAAKREGELPDTANAKTLAEFFSGQVLALAVMARAGADRKSLYRFIDVAMKALPKGSPANASIE